MSNYSINNGLPYPYRRLIIRIVDIGIIGMVYLVIGICITKFIEKKVMYKFDKEKYEKKYTLTLILEVFLYVWIIVNTHYFLRKIMKYDTFRFFGGLYGYNNNKTAEMRGGVILSIAIIKFHVEFIKKLEYLVNERLKL